MCREAENARHRELRACRAETVATDQGIQHGTVSTDSNRGCRCEARYQTKSAANQRRPSRAKSG